MPVRPIIAISTLPRVGSMWAFNVARALAAAAGYPVVPERALKQDGEMLAAADAWLRDGPADAFCIIKVHQPLYPRPDLKVIYLQRDIRDRIFSICRFDQRELNAQSAREMVRNHLQMDAHYAGWPAGQILQLSFEQLETDSLPLVGAIAHFIGLDQLDAASLAGIDAQFSKRAVRRLVARLDTSDQDRLRGTSQIRGTTASARQYDERTGFQTGHVSDYRPGDWRQLWSEEQKAIVAAAIEAEQNADAAG